MQETVRVDFEDENFTVLVEIQQLQLKLFTLKNRQVVNSEMILKIH